MRYAYTPDGAMRYKAAKKMSGMAGMEMPDEPKPSKPKMKKSKPKTKSAPKMMGY